MQPLKRGCTIYSLPNKICCAVSTRQSWSTEKRLVAEASASFGRVGLLLTPATPFGTASATAPSPSTTPRPETATPSASSQVALIDRHLSHRHRQRLAGRCGYESRAAIPRGTRHL